MQSNALDGARRASPPAGRTANASPVSRPSVFSAGTGGRGGVGCAAFGIRSERHDTHPDRTTRRGRLNRRGRGTGRLARPRGPSRRPRAVRTDRHARRPRARRDGVGRGAPQTPLRKVRAIFLDNRPRFGILAQLRMERASGFPGCVRRCPRRHPAGDSRLPPLQGGLQGPLPPLRPESQPGCLRVPAPRGGPLRVVRAGRPGTPRTRQMTDRS